MTINVPPQMKTAAVIVHILRLGRVELNNAFVSVPKQGLHDAHFLP